MLVHDEAQDVEMIVKWCNMLVRLYRKLFLIF